MAQYAAGLDVGAHSVKLVLGQVRMRSISIVDRREALIERDESGRPAEGALERAVAEVARDLPKTTVVYSSLPGDAVLVRTVQIPRVAARRSDAIVRTEVEDDLPLEIDEAIVDHVDRPLPDRPMLRCLVVAASQETVAEHLASLELHGLDPAEVGVGAALYSSLARVCPELASPEPVMVVDMGARRTDMAVIEGGEAVSMRTVSVGGIDLTDVLAAHYRCSFEKAEEYKVGSGWMQLSQVLSPALDRILPQIRQTLSAYRARTGTAVGKLLLCGGTALMEGLAPTMAQSLSMDVSHLVDELDPSMGETRQTAPFLEATALLYRTLLSPADQRFDMRRGPFTFRGQARATRRRWVRAVVAGLVVVLGWSFYSLARITSLEARQAKQRDRLAVVSERYLGEEITDFSLAEKKMQSARPIKSPLPKADAFDFISEMSRIIPEEIIHDVEQLEIKPGKVQIRGIVDTISARDEVIARLEEYTECVKNISKGKTTKSPKDNRQKYNLDLETECP
jgi:type IV pilus assembly protein PilM